MKKTTILTSIFVGLIATTFVLTATAQNRRYANDDENQGMRADKIERLFKKLNLTEKQETQIRSLHEQKMENNKARREQMKELRKEMKAAWNNEPIDKSKIKQIHKKMHELRGKMGEERLDFFLKVHDILNKEQRQEAKKIFQKHYKKGNKCGFHGKCKGKRGKGKRQGKGQGQGRGQGQGQGMGYPGMW